MSKKIVTSELAVNRHDQGAKKLNSLLNKNGYLFLKNLIDQSIVLAAYKEVFNMAAKKQYLEKTFHPSHAVLNKNLKTNKTFLREIEKFSIKWSSKKQFNATAKDSSLLKFLSSTLGGPVINHPFQHAIWGRMVFPQIFADCSPAHQDFEYVGVPEDTYTVWIPLTDCPVYLGGLALVPGSHKHGYVEKPARIFQHIQKKKLSWSSTNYQAGDCLIFHSQTIHMPLPNETTSTVRFSIDARYCRKDLFDANFVKDKSFGHIKR